MKKTPNLFDYAQKELSHDAFFCWLADCANSNIKEYNDIGKRFLNLLIDKISLEKDSFNDLNLDDKNIEVFNQKSNMDIIITIKPRNNKNNIMWVILIENKIKSKQHSGQLVRYREKITNDYDIILDSKDYILDEKNLGCVYLRPEYQANYLPVLASGFLPIHGNELLDIFEDTKLVEEDTLINSYYRYLKEKINRKSWVDLYREILKDSKFRKVILNGSENRLEYLKNKYDTESKEYIFLDQLKEKEYNEFVEEGYFLDKHYVWVNNQSGGFPCLYFGEIIYEPDSYQSLKFKGDRRIRIKLQFESYNKGKNMRVGAVVKTIKKSHIDYGIVKGINKDEVSNLQTNIRKELWDKAQNYNKIKDQLFVRPPRFGHGGHMTFAVLKDLDNIEIDKDKIKDNDINIYNNGNKIAFDDVIDILIEGVKGLEYINEEL